MFYSYDYRDEYYRNELEKHLIILSRQGLITTWHNRKIIAGNDWSDEVKAHLDSADIILLLVSPDFLASDFCYEFEMKRALERHNTGDAFVIPILVRPVDWEHTPFESLSSLAHEW